MKQPPPCPTVRITTPPDAPLFEQKIAVHPSCISYYSPPVTPVLVSTPPRAGSWPPSRRAESPAAPLTHRVRQAGQSHHRRPRGHKPPGDGMPVGLESVDGSILHGILARWNGGRTFQFQPSTLAEAERSPDSGRKACINRAPWPGHPVVTRPLRRSLAACLFWAVSERRSQASRVNHRTVDCFLPA